METTEIFHPVESDLETPVTREGLTTNAKPVAKTFGVFTVGNYAATTTPLTITHDVVAQYVSVFSDGLLSVQLGPSVDGFSKIPLIANGVIRIPTQGIRSITLKAGTTANVCVVWHDDPYVII